MRFPFSITSLILAAPLLMAGCSYEQSKPPTPEGMVLIKSRTGVGTEFTKMEARPMTFPPKANEVSIWDIKVFDIKDKETGERKEWKFFNQLPQSGESGGTTDVLMRAWIISKDRSVFLPQTPSYKAYGSFVTDWTIPKTGDYSLFVEYQPASTGENIFEKKIYPLEMSRWDFTARPNGKANAATVSLPVPPTPAKAVSNGKELIYQLASLSDSGTQGPQISFSHGLKPKAGERVPLEFGLKEGTISNQDVSALSPDGNQFIHVVGEKGHIVFRQKGNWDLWLTFKKDGEKYTSHGNIKIS